MKTCFLHIGSEKTGTTSIQRYFANNREELLDLGFWYPKCCVYEKGAAHRRLSDQALHGSLDAEDSFTIEFRREYENAAAKGAHSAVISSEFFHSHFRDEVPIRRLGDFLSSHFEAIHVIYYARRQDHLAVSMHAMGVRGGRSTFTRATSVYDRKQRHYFDHLAVCNLWAEVFGHENMICRIFEKAKLRNGDAVDDFETIIGLAPDPRRERGSANESVSYLCLNILLRLNGSRHRDNEVFRRRLLQSDRDSSNTKLPFLTKAEAIQFMERFSETNQEFFSKYVDPALATGFDESFESFPEALPEPSANAMLDLIFAPKTKGPATE